MVPKQTLVMLTYGLILQIFAFDQLTSNEILFHKNNILVKLEQHSNEFQHLRLDLLVYHINKLDSDPYVILLDMTLIHLQEYSEHMYNLYDIYCHTNDNKTKTLSKKKILDKLEFLGFIEEGLVLKDLNICKKELEYDLSEKAIKETKYLAETLKQIKKILE